MGKTLGFYPLFIAGVAVTAILVICIINMYLLARHKRNYITVFIHILSLFVAFGLIFHMMGVAVFVHPISEIYRWLSMISFLLAGSTIVCCVVFAVIFGKKYSLRNLPYSILDALKNIDEVVFVIDCEGNILHINHPEKYFRFFGRINTLEELQSFLKEHCATSEEAYKPMESISGNQICELYFEWAKTNAIIQIAPIAFGGNWHGYTAVLEDVTAIRNIEKKLSKQNEALVFANERLSNYIMAAGALEAEKERLLILSQVQETLINDIEKVLPSIYNIKQHCFENGSYQIAMREFAIELRSIYEKVRSAVGHIAGKEGKE